MFFCFRIVGALSCVAMWGGLALLSIGCTRVPGIGDDCVAKLVAQRLQKPDEDCCIDEDSEELVWCLLRQPLTVDSAVQVALLINPTIQAALEDIGIAHADLVQAALLPNPIFDGFVRFPSLGGLSVNTEFSLAQNLVGILLAPLRQQVASAELRQAQLRTANSILDLAFDVQETYYRLSAEQEKQALLESLVDAAEVAHELAKGQVQQGNVNELELQSRTAEYLEAKVLFARSRITLIKLRTQMNELLGLNPSEGCWTIVSTLPAPCESLPCQEDLDALALAQRLDVQVALWEVERLKRLLPTYDWWTYTGLAVGVSTEKDAEGPDVTGPSFSTAIPIFDHGQASRQRVRAQYRQAIERLAALQIRVLGEVSSMRDQLEVRRELTVAYQNELLPLQQAIVGASQRFYNVMGLGVYRLINTKRLELQMQADFIEARKDYWVTRVALHRALGGDL